MEKVNNIEHYIGGTRSFRLVSMVTLLLKELKRRLWMREYSYLLSYELEQVKASGKKLTPIDIKPACGDEILSLVTPLKSSKSLEELRFYIEILMFTKENIPQPYIGFRGDIPVGFCWLFYADQNESLKKYFNNTIPNLHEDDALLEFIFVEPRYRSSFLMRDITLELFRIAALSGKTSAYALVKSDNMYSLRGANKIGWQPISAKRMSWKFFMRKSIFTALTDNEIDYFRYCE